MQIVMGESTARVPPEILHILQFHVEAISRVLVQLEPQNPFWTSLRESGFSLEVLGWKFRFGVDADKLVLTDVQAVPAPVT